MTDRVIAAARGWIGTPYHLHASRRGAGCDCIGLIRGVWREVAGPEPHPVPQYRHGSADAAPGLIAAQLSMWMDRAAPAPGRVALFRVARTRAPRHLGILTEDGVITAVERRGVVEMRRLPPWRLAGAWAVPEG